MALDPGLMLLLGQLFGPILGQLGAPEGQEMETFAGQNPDGTLFEHDPRRLVNESKNLLNQHLGALTARAASPVTLRSSYVQQPGAYTGGGLPMPIGLVAQDPALADPSLLSIPGLDFSKLAIQPDGQQAPRQTNQFPLPEDRPTPDPNEWKSMGSDDGMFGGMPGTRGADLLAEGPDENITNAGGDDFDQAMGAIDLLMKALEGSA